LSKSINVIEQPSPQQESQQDDEFYMSTIQAEGNQSDITISSITADVWNIDP